MMIFISVALGLIAGFVSETLRKSGQRLGLAGFVVLLVAAIVLWENYAKAEVGPWYAYFTGTIVLIGFVGSIMESRTQTNA